MEVGICEQIDHKKSGCKTAVGLQMQAYAGGGGTYGGGTVSYTHLDVYKRQVFFLCLPGRAFLPEYEPADNEKHN